MGNHESVFLICNTKVDKVIIEDGGGCGRLSRLDEAT